jgi:hypothetical protein
METLISVPNNQLKENCKILHAHGPVQSFVHLRMGGCIACNHRVSVHVQGD